MAIHRLVTTSSKDLLQQALKRERERLKHEIERRKIRETRAAAKRGSSPAKRNTPKGPPKAPDQDDQGSQDTSTTAAPNDSSPEKKSWGSAKASRFGGVALRGDLGMAD